MKKTSRIILSLIVVVIVFSSCEKVTGDGPVVTETRNIVNYSGVDLRVSANVYFREDPNFKVEISAQRNILDVMETYVSDNKLVIKFKNDVRVHSHDPVTIMVSAPTADHLRISGSGNISVIGLLSPSRLEMDISGSGNIIIPQVATGWIDADISGSGNITINSGVGTDEQLKISGSGSIDLSNVTSNNAITNTSGSGDIMVNLSRTLDVKISGSGSVYYKGSPIINAHVSGSGKVIHI